LEKVLALDEPLKQRVAIRIKLNAYSEEDTRNYIQHRMKVAGCGTDIFTDKAISMIFRYSNGVPRLINTICDNALLEGFLFKTSAVDDAIIKTVAVDLGLEN
jgi:type II secretory pathway predicted ATPase ExeA